MNLHETALTLLTPSRSYQFYYKSSLIWNKIYKKALATKIFHFKSEIRKIIFSNQNEGDQTEWQKSNLE